MKHRLFAACAATVVGIAAANAATFGTDAGGAVYRGSRIGVYDYRATTVARGLQLTDCDVKYTYFKAVPDAQIRMVDGVAFPYCRHWEDIGGTNTLVVEFQRYNHRESQTYCCEACFYQDGDDIKAYLRRALISPAFNWRLGQSFVDLYDLWGDPGVKIDNRAVTERQGQGLTHVVLAKNTVVRPTSAADIESALTVKRGTELVIDKYVYESNKTFQALSKTVDGVLTMRNFSGSYDLSGSVTGTEGGEIRLENSMPEGGVVSYTHPESGVISDKDIVVTDAPLWAITNITAVNGGTVMGGKRMNFQMFFWNNHSDRATFQLHAMGTYGGEACLYAGRFKLTRNDGDNVEFGVMNQIRYVLTTNEQAVSLAKGKGVAPGAINPFSLSSGNFVECTWPSTATGGGCNLTNLTFYFKDVSSVQNLKIANLIPTGGVLRVRGLRGAKATMRVSSKTAVPTNGTVFVEEGGRFEVNCSGDASGYGLAGNTAEIYVSTNGELAICSGANYPFGSGRFVSGESQKIFIDGGKMTGTSSKNGSIDVSRLFVGRLTLANGAYATGPAQWRIGNSQSVSTNFVWYVTGKTPSTFDAGWALYGPASGVREHFIVSVDDVTGDEDADFIVGGETIPDREQWGTTYTCVPIIKIGAGTMSLTGVFRTDSPLRIEEGKVHLAKSDALVVQTPVPVVLAGGGLSTAANSENTAGTLAVLGGTGVTNELVVAEGTQLAFADSSDVGWDEESKLTITGTIGPKTIRFGTTSGGLTARQQRQIRINGERGRGHLDANGYLVDDGIPGMVLIFR